MRPTDAFRDKALFLLCQPPKICEKCAVLSMPQFFMEVPPARWELRGIDETEKGLKII